MGPWAVTEPPTMVPSLIVTILLALLWIDYAAGAMLYWKRRHSRGAFREYVVSIAAVLVAITMGVSIVMEYYPPGAPDTAVVTALATGRMVLLIVGAWLAWDRRRSP